MKNIVILAVCLWGINGTSIAQCTKKITWTGSKAEFLNANDSVERTINEKVVVISSKTDIKLMHNDKEDDALTGKIKDFSCTWSEAFKNGKTVIKSDLAEGVEHSTNGIVTIEAKNGKITILVALDDHDGKTIKIYIDNYQETE